eukprot:gene11750-5088_t
MITLSLTRIGYTFFFLNTLFTSTKVFTTELSTKNGMILYSIPGLILVTEIIKFITNFSIWSIIKSLELRIQISHNPPEILSESEPCTKQQQKTTIERLKTAFTESLSFFIPALLISISQNLSILALLYLDMSTFQSLLNTRIIVSAFLYRIFFNKNFSKIQYFSLIILLNSIILSRWNYEHHLGFSQKIFIGFLIMIFIIICDSLSYVVLEMIIKKKFETSLYFQNCSLSFYSIFINLFLYIIREIFFEENGLNFQIFHDYNIYTLITMISILLVGITSNGILKYLDTIALIFSNTSTVVILTLISAIQMRSFVSIQFLLSIICIASSILIYTTEENKLKLEDDYFQALISKI